MKLEESPLYKLKSQKSLCDILNININDIKYLQTDKFYSIKWAHGKPCQRPQKRLEHVHQIMKDLLSEIELPYNVFAPSQKGKGKNNITNAYYHKECYYLLALDIKSFFESTKIEYVFRFFHYKLKIKESIAWILSDIVTYQKRIPRGSFLSSLMAYWANANIFDNLTNYCDKVNIKFSIYVDDITFSSQKRLDIQNIVEATKKILAYNKLKLKYKKLKCYSKYQCKCVTGVIITPKNELKIPNKIRKSIIDDIDSDKTLLGKIAYADQIEQNHFNKIKEKIIKR